MDRRHKGTCAVLRGAQICARLAPLEKKRSPITTRRSALNLMALGVPENRTVRRHRDTIIHPSCVEVIERIDASSSPSVPHLNFPLPYDRTKNQKSFLSPSFIDCRSSPFRSLCRISNGIHGFLPVTCCLSYSCLHNHLCVQDKTSSQVIHLRCCANSNLN